MNNELINTNETVTNNSIPTTNIAIAAATTPPIITTINNNNNENINSNINKRNVSVIHQILVISNIDFENENIYGFTELSLAPNINNNNVITSTTNELTFDTICLNLKQCKILYLCFNGSIETEYEYCDPSLVKPCNDETKRDLQSLLYQDELGRLAVDADESNGELLIQVPEPVREQLKNGINIKLAIEFILEKPIGGIRFVLDDGSDQQQPTTNPYLYTIENSSYCWFPCLNSYNEYCTWKIEVIVDEDLTVISSGSLIETELINFKTIDNCSMDLSTNVSQTNIETNKKKFHFYVTQPTCAPNIGLVVGRFECQQDENISELVYYSDPVLMDLVKNSCAFLQDAFEFYEDILGKHYPHTSPFKLIFVYDTHEDCFHYSNMAILNVCLLHSKQIIEQTFLTRRLIANALARQYFGCFITMFNWHSWWLLTGLAAHLTGLYLKKILGNNEYKYMIYQDMKEVCSYEREHGYILLDLNFNEFNSNFNSKETANKCNILLKNPLIASLNYLKVAEKKSHLVIRLIDECLGREIMIQLLNKILNEAINCSTVAAQKAYSFNCWSNLALSTESFTDTLATFSSKDIKHLLDHWVYRSGCARLNVIFNFNRKKNTLELELKQDMANQKGYKKYIGPITFIIQELDGSFSHHLQVDDQVPCKFDIALHSKGKKSKKKKIPLITGEEVDIDTSQMDSDSPILWIRIDPDMKIIREIKFDQPDHHWQHQLRYERDICAQLDALDYLTRFPTAHTRSTLVSCIENNECFFRVRVQASYALAEIANKMVHNWNGPLPFISTFKTFFKSPSAINIVKSNNFSDIQLYYLQKNIPIAMGNLRTVHNLCPAEVVRFILDLIKYNENSKNRFSDCYYRAALIDGLSNTLSSSVASLNTFGGSKSSNLSADLHSVIEEIVLRLNLEKILPSYHFLISASCLKALRKLQKLGHIPEDKNIFKQYALNKNTFDELRMIAFEILIDFLTLRHDDDLFCLLIDSIETDHSNCVKQHIIQQLVKHASAFKFNFDEVSKHSENYVNKIWCLMNRFNLNYRMKSSLVELYHSFYGFNKPKCLRQVKETLKISETIEAVNLF